MVARGRSFKARHPPPTPSLRCPRLTTTRSSGASCPARVERVEQPGDAHRLGLERHRCNRSFGAGPVQSYGWRTAPEPRGRERDHKLQCLGDLMGVLSSAQSNAGTISPMTAPGHARAISASPKGPLEYRTVSHSKLAIASSDPSLERAAKLKPLSLPPREQST